MNTSRRRAWRRLARAGAQALLTTALFGHGLPAMAQDYPAKPVTLVVPAPPGGATDVIARALGDEMGRRMGQTVIVDNKPGALGVVGANSVARAAPDGYTLLLTTTAAILTTPLLFAKPPYDVRRDLAFITHVSSVPLVLVVGKDVPARTMKEFVAWAQQHKGKVAYGSYGVGSAGHLISAHLDSTRQLGMTHVPYKGEAPMIQDIIGGQVSWGIGTLGTAAPHLESGRLRALAVMDDRPFKDLPNLPTIEQAGFPDPELRQVGGLVLMAPAATPPAVLARLEKDVRAAIQSPAVKARMQVYGMTAIGNSAADFRREYEAGVPLAERMVRLSGAKLD